MHPALTASVSALSYEAGCRRGSRRRPTRSLDGVEPGLPAVPVTTGATRSVARRGRPGGARSSAGTSGARGPTRGDAGEPLEQRDIIVVAPYNAQVALIRERAGRSGLPAVPVGTVDKFQGREAVVAIVSLAASSPMDVPRGISFVLMRNRLNVAISRAKWASSSSTPPHSPTTCHTPQRASPS